MLLNTRYDCCDIYNFLLLKGRWSSICLITTIQERISGELHYQVSYRKAWTTKQKALAKLFGDWEESYDELLRWLAYMSSISPGSYYYIYIDDYVGVDGLVDGVLCKFSRLF